MTSQQFEQITAWQAKTFPASTASSKIEHLKQEVSELAHDLKDGGDGRWLEFADCFILLFGAAHADGMTYEDICDMIDRKMEINKARKWGKPDQNGVVNHIKETLLINEDSWNSLMKEGRPDFDLKTINPNS